MITYKDFARDTVLVSRLSHEDDTGKMVYTVEELESWLAESIEHFVQCQSALSANLIV